MCLKLIIPKLSLRRGDSITFITSSILLLNYQPSIPNHTLMLSESGFLSTAQLAGYVQQLKTFLEET
uniref:Uncharacterized protein n=1 Tax=Rhizophora mucronata TaxID=61149 RepID=A0A2P2QBJ8_RHIMU